MLMTLPAALFEADLAARIEQWDDETSDPIEFCIGVRRDLARLKLSVEKLEAAGDSTAVAARLDYRLCEIDALGACDAALSDWRPIGKAN